MDREDMLKYAEAFIARKGFEVEEEGFEAQGFAADFVITDMERGALAFIVVKEGMEPYGREHVAEFEAAVMEYLSAHPDMASCTIRLDTLEVNAVGEDRAFVKYTYNVLNRLS